MILNEQLLSGLAALITSISSLIWTLRRGASNGDRPSHRQASHRYPKLTGRHSAEPDDEALDAKDCEKPFAENNGDESLRWILPGN